MARSGMRGVSLNHSGVDPFNELALHVVKQAVKDARAGQQEAAAWLRHGAGGIFEVFDVDAARVDAALNRPKQKRLRR